jgi:hypothetical protein
VPGFGGGLAAIYPNAGWAAGGHIGYDSVGPRVELEGVYCSNAGNASIGGFNFGETINRTAVVSNVCHDLNTGDRPLHRRWRRYLVVWAGTSTSSSA